MTRWIDTHYHYEFLDTESKRESFLQTLKEFDIEIVPQTILPSSYPCHQGLKYRSIGFHPWWIRSDEQVKEELSIFKEQIKTTRFIGEIGLDFSHQRAKDNHSLQIKTLNHLLEMIKKQSQASKKIYVMSLHGIGAFGELIDQLVTHQIYDSGTIPIMHWYTGSGEDLVRHRDLGGYFSINPWMLQTKKGRSYVTQLPKDRILLETDLPWSETVAEKSGEELAEDVNHALKETVETVERLRKEPMEETILDNQCRIYGES